MVCEMAEYRRLIRLLVARRQHLKLTQVDVNTRMRLSDNLVNRWENFRRFPKGPMLIRWAQALGLKLRVQAIVWAKPNYVPFTDEQLAAPEHRSHRGFDIGDCRGKMIPLHEKPDGRRAVTLRKLEGQ